MNPRRTRPAGDEPAQRREPARRLAPGQAHCGQRVDNFLLGRLKGMPRPRIYRMLRRGEVRVNGARVGPSYRLSAEDSLRLPPLWLPPSALTLPASEACLRLIAASIRYEDDELIVLDKPARLAVHGGSGLRTSVIDALRELRPEERRLELVHRLDRETSGCLMVAKKASALRQLQALLRDGQIDKRYTALCAGRWAGAGPIDAALLKSHRRDGGHSVRVSEDGRRASTFFAPLRRFAGATLLRASPLTGRTHQIRVHASAAGHPLLGDDKYGDAPSRRLSRSLGLKRMFLHASSIRVPRGSGAPLRVTCPLPDELRRALAIISASPDRTGPGATTTLQRP